MLPFIVEEGRPRGVRGPLRRRQRTRGAGAATGSTRCYDRITPALRSPSAPLLRTIFRRWLRRSDRAGSVLAAGAAAAAADAAGRDAVVGTSRHRRALERAGKRPSTASMGAPTDRTARPAISASISSAPARWRSSACVAVRSIALRSRSAPIPTPCRTSHPHHATSSSSRRTRALGARARPHRSLWTREGRHASSCRSRRCWRACSRRAASASGASSTASRAARTAERTHRATTGHTGAGGGAGSGGAGRGALLRWQQRLHRPR